MTKPTSRQRLMRTMDQRSQHRLLDSRIKPLRQRLAPEFRRVAQELSEAYPSQDRMRVAIQAHRERLWGILSLYNRRSAADGAQRARQALDTARQVKADTAAGLLARINTVIDAQTGKKIVGMAADTMEHAANIISLGVNDNQHPDEIARAIRDVVESMSRGRAERIARTETHGAIMTGQNESMVSAAEEMGLTLVKVWVATSDERTRETHTEADGQRVAMDETFHVGESRLAYPGDPDGPAGEIINCRCTVVYEEATTADVEVAQEQQSQSEVAVVEPEIGDKIVEIPDDAFILRTTNQGDNVYKGAQAIRSASDAELTRLDFLPTHSAAQMPAIGTIRIDSEACRLLGQQNGTGPSFAFAYNTPKFGANSGGIVFSLEAHRDLQAGLLLLRTHRQYDRQTVRGLGTLFHEDLHMRGPMIAYNTPGRIFVEEVTTELSARYITARVIASRVPGLSADRVIGTRVMDVGAYQEWIGHAQVALKNATGTDWNESARLLSEMAVRWKRRTGRSTDTLREWSSILWKELNFKPAQANQFLRELDSRGYKRRDAMMVSTLDDAKAFYEQGDVDNESAHIIAMSMLHLGQLDDLVAWLAGIEDSTALSVEQLVRQPGGREFQLDKTVPGK